MKLETRCHCCHCKLTLTVDDAYMELGDPMKLLAAAVCNSCHDHHEREVRIRFSIFDLCLALDRGVKRERADRIRVLLSDATRKYAEIIALIQDRDTMLFEEAFPQMLFDHPEQCPKILRKYRKDCARKFIPEPAGANASTLPYKDH